MANRRGRGDPMSEGECISDAKKLLSPRKIFTLCENISKMVGGMLEHQRQKLVVSQI